MIDNSLKTPHYRLLSLLDELHRIGLEQLRFSRSFSTMYARVYVYAARSAKSQDRESGSSPVSFVFSNDVVYLSGRDDGHMQARWTELLTGTMKPRHLAAQFVLDFPEIARPAYGPDHEYRTWFRKLRPHLEAGLLPFTWREDIYKGDSEFYLQSVLMIGPQTEDIIFPRPPRNPYAD